VDSSAPRRHLAAIVSADVAGYSRLMADDEDATVQTLAAHRLEAEALIDAHRGRLVDFTGDNFLAEFPSALDGVRCAIEIQRVFGRRNEELLEHRRMRFRVGIHLGDVRVEEDRIYGDGVNIASRLEGLAEPGGICVSSNVRDLIHGKLDLGYRDLGEQRVKNIPQPVRAYLVIGEGSTNGPGRVGILRGRVVLVTLAALVAAVVAAGVVISQRWDRAGNGGRGVASLELPRGPSVAVLPFANVSGDPAQEYFSDGLTEDIITGLSRFSELFVIARHSTFHYKRTTADVRDVGRELGVRYVLEGSVRRAGERVRVTAQLSDAGDGRQLWAEVYDRDLTAGDLFGLQDELTDRVVGAVTGTYGAISRAGLVESRRKTTDSLDAYDCVLRTYEYLQIHTAANHLAARNCLERVVDLDADYADAWAWLAYTYAEEHRHRWNAQPELYDSLERALEVAERALGLDPRNQVAHGAVALTYFGRRQYDRFVREVEKTVAINPNNALWLALFGTYLAQRGDFDRALPMVGRALSLDPNPPLWLHITPFLDSYRDGRYEEAVEAAQRITSGDTYQARVFLAAAYGQLGRHDEAARALAELDPDSAAAVREELRASYGYADEVIEPLIEGLHEAGLER